SITMSVIPYVLLTSVAGQKKAKITATGLRKPHERKKDLKLVSELIESGEIKPVIDREYKLDDIAEAHRYVETGRKRGNVVVSI
ncbi:MAG: zinc-binding dehydrogenase, partial [Bacteroidota bacterium]